MNTEICIELNFIFLIINLTTKTIYLFSFKLLINWLLIYNYIAIIIEYVFAHMFGVCQCTKAGLSTIRLEIMPRTIHSDGFNCSTRFSMSP